MRVNFYIPGYKHLVGGIKTSATRIMHGLQEEGVNVKINSKSGYDIIHTHMFDPATYLKIGSVRKKGIKSVTHAHSADFDCKNSFALSNFVLYPTLKYYLPKYYSRADMIIAVSPFMKRWVESKTHKKNVVSIFNPVDKEKLRSNENDGKAFRKNMNLEKDFIVMDAGIAVIRKGIDLFNEMAKRHPDIKFIWVGTKLNPLSTSEPLKIWNIYHNHPKNMIFLGFYPNITAVMNACDIFCSPSESETQGMSVAEACCVGKPVVVRKIPAYDGWLVDGKNCLASSRAGVEKNIIILKEDRKLRQRLARNAIKLRNDFNIRHISRQIIGVYENLLD